MTRTIRSTLIAALAASVAFATASGAAFDSAADAVYNSGWSSGMNGGFGFNAWSLSGSANSGQFVFDSNANGSGSGPGINSAGRAWGQYANSGSVALASRSFASALSVGDVFECDFDNGWIDNGGAVALQLWSGSNFSGNFSFAGGESNYKVLDNSGFSVSTLGFTDGGLHLKWTITAAGYDLAATSLSSAQTWNYSGVFQNAGAIDKIVFTNSNAGFNGERNAYLNNLSITPVPEPGTIIAVALGMAATARQRRKS